MLLVNMVVIFGGLLLTCLKNRKIKKEKSKMVNKRAQKYAMGIPLDGERPRPNQTWALKRRALFESRNTEQAQPESVPREADKSSGGGQVAQSEVYFEISEPT